MIDGMAALRVATGMFFVPHIIGKLRDPMPARAFFLQAGLPNPSGLVALAILTETLIVVGLVAGVAVFSAALLGTGFLAVAAIAVWHASNKQWMWFAGGSEYPAFWACVCAVLAIEHL